MLTERGLKARTVHGKAVFAGHFLGKLYREAERIIKMERGNAVYLAVRKAALHALELLHALL